TSPQTRLASSALPSRRRCGRSANAKTEAARGPASGASGVRHGDALHEHDAVRCAAAAVVVGHDVQGAAVVAAEHAREAAAIGVDRVEDLAACSYPGAALSRNAGIPDRALGGGADAVRR